MRLAHISDLHFSKLSWSPFQFLSKRWLGNLNLIFKRKNLFATERLSSLIECFEEKGVDGVIISGDLATTSFKKEFSLAAAFVEELKQKDFDVFVLPGNHDHYTRSACRRKLFYNFFDPYYSKAEAQPSLFNLKEHRVSAKQLSESWWLIGLDTAEATSLISSRGSFSFEMEKHLEQLLNLIPKEHQVIIANHFPLFATDGPRKALGRADALQALLKRFPQIKLYLHGHTHRHSIADLRPNNFPIVLDSGSTTHRESGTWNLLDISSHGCHVQVFKWECPSWLSFSQTHFRW